MGLSTDTISQQLSNAINNTLGLGQQAPQGPSTATSTLVNGTLAYATFIAHDNSQPRVSETRVTFQEQPLTISGGRVTPGTVDATTVVPSVGTLSLNPGASSPPSLVVPAIDSRALGLSGWQITPPQAQVGTGMPTVTLGAFNATPEGEPEDGTTGQTFSYVDEVLMVGIAQAVPATPSSPGNGG